MPQGESNSPAESRTYVQGRFLIGQFEKGTPIDTPSRLEELPRPNLDERSLRNPMISNNDKTISPEDSALKMKEDEEIEIDNEWR